MASVACRYFCFHMVISRHVGLCFPSHRLPKRSTSQCCQCFPPTESMQISRKTSVKICSAWLGICWSESPLALFLGCVRQLLSPLMCPFYSHDKVFIFLFKGEFYSHLLWYGSSTDIAGKKKNIIKEGLYKWHHKKYYWKYGVKLRENIFSSSPFSFTYSW